MFVLLCGCVAVLLDRLGCPKLPWNVDTALMGIVFMYFGFLVKEKGLLARTNVLISLLLIPLGLYLINLNPVSTVSFDGNSYGNPILMVSGAAAMIFAITLPIMRTESLAERWYIKCFSIPGQHTLFIMAFDYLSRTLCIHGLKINEMDWALVLAGKIVILCIGYTVWSMMLRKIKNEQLRQLLAF